jgi:hypothetical protein
MRIRFVETLLVQVMLAISVSQVWAGCLKPPVSAQLIGQFQSNPQALVAPNSDIRTIEADARDLAATDASLAAELIRLAEGTTPRFKTAIAAGLAQAAIACADIDQQAALLIQQALASFQDGTFQASFAAVAGDISTAATAAATASAGSMIVTNPNTSTGPNSTLGGGGAISALVVLTTAAVTSSTTTATTAADAVSATR